MTLSRTLSELDATTRDRLTDELRPDEAFVCGATVAEADFTRFRTRFLVTDQRILTVKRGWIRTKTRSMPLSAITNIQTSETTMLKLRLDAMGDIDGEYIFELDDGRAIAEAMRRETARPAQVA